MSNYTQNTDFSALDLLDNTDPNKVIRGQTFDDEFSEIATAIATKANRPASAVTIGHIATFVDTDGNLQSGAKALPSGDIVGTTDSQALSFKTITLGSNTITGTKAQFNAAMTDADFCTLDGTEILSAKTLTSPTVNGGTHTGINIDSTSTIDSITATNLVDKSAAETITGAWDKDGFLIPGLSVAFTGSIITDSGTPFSTSHSGASTTVATGARMALINVIWSLNCDADGTTGYLNFSYDGGSTYKRYDTITGYSSVITHNLGTVAVPCHTDGKVYWQIELSTDGDGWAIDADLIAFFN